MCIYTDHPLVHGERSSSIRLLQIDTRNQEENSVSCTLDVVTLDDHPKYTALSYVWGDSSHLRSIYINGQAFHVRENLWQFLFQARASQHKTALWIDAICIDQTKISERNHQVALMGGIYSQAETVIVWLGSGSNRSTAVAMTEIEALRAKRKAPANWAMFCAGLTQFCDLEYWTRVWIVQEYILANKVEFWYGEVRLPEEAALWIHQLETDTSHLHGDKKHQSWGNTIVSLTRGTPALDIVGCKVNRSQYPNSIIFPRLLDIAGRQECYDPRDRVFAILSLIRPIERDRLKISVDYSKSAGQLFEELYMILRREIPRKMDLMYYIPKLQSIFELEDDDDAIERVRIDFDTIPGRIYLPPQDSATDEALDDVDYERIFLHTESERQKKPLRKPKTILATIRASLRIRKGATE